MRSLGYIMGGKPGSFADCVDHAARHRLKSVKMALKSCNDVGEALIIRRMLGFFTWEFEDLVVTYDEQFGGIVEAEDAERQGKSVENANRRLERRLRDFAEFKIEVNGDEARFRLGMKAEDCGENPS